MKKMYAALIGLMALPSTVFAQISSDPSSITPTSIPTALPSEIDFGNLLTIIINWFLGLVGLIAVLMLIYGGFRYLTSGGNEESVDKAKKTIMYALIGIVVVILSYAIVATITSAFTVSHA